MASFISISVADTKKFFSLLSITSYSSFAFHKFSVAVYNSKCCWTLLGGRDGEQWSCRARFLVRTALWILSLSQFPT